MATIVGLASWIVQGVCNDINLQSMYSMYWLPFWANLPDTVLQSSPNNKRQLIIHDFCSLDLDHQWDLQVT